MLREGSSRSEGLETGKNDMGLKKAGIHKRNMEEKIVKLNWLRIKKYIFALMLCDPIAYIFNI